MQGKGLIKFFIIALLVVCLFQLLFSVIAWRVENKATDYASEKVFTGGKTMESVQGTPEADSLTKEVASYRRRYLDSVSKENVVDLPLLKFTYEQVKKQQIKLGLDLKGGMSVVLQVSEEAIIKAMSNNSKDSTFLKALKNSVDQQKTTQEGLVTVFGREFQKLDPGAKLAAIFATPENPDIGFNSTNEEVLAAIQRQVDGSVSQTFSTVRSRIDAFGVAGPNLTLQESTGRIFIELPGVDNPDAARKLLQSTAKLEFWETFQVSELINKVAEANKLLVSILGLVDSSKLDTTATAGLDSLLGLKADTTATAVTPDSNNASALDSLLGSSDTTKKDELAQQAASQNPLFSVLIPPVNESGQLVVSPNDATIGFARPQDRAKVNQYLSYEQIRALFPKNIKFLWGAKPNENGFFPLYAIKTRPNEDRAPLEGDVIRDASQDIDQSKGVSEVVVEMAMNSEGAKTWKRLTAENSPKTSGERGKCIAIVMDDVVYTAPEVRSEIPNGRSQITGNFTISEAKALASIIKAGKLPAPAKIIQEEVVGPTLGKESIRAGLMSMVMGFLAVVLFMVLYYNTSGLIADVALILNLIFIVGVLASYGAALTLPGMAGIVLTLGMAVDANVIINERIREELAKGKGLRLAVADGYSGSYSAIIDGNLTTLITAIILMFYGLGPVKGFATTLTIGLISSMITAVLVARLLTENVLSREKTIKFTTKLSENVFRNANFDFVGKRKYAYIFSGILTVVGLISIFTKGFELGVDFKGGRSYVVRFDKPVSTQDVSSKLNDVFGAYPVVKTYGSSNQVMITTAYMIDNADTKTDSLVEAKLFEGLKPMYDKDLTSQQFAKEYKIQSIKVGPAIADDIKSGAFKAGLLSILAIFIYIVFRFKTWQFGLGAIAATVHDSLVMLSVFSIFGGMLPFSTEVDQTFIAALLTIIGYSVNDTVVVFDRLREYIALHPTKDFKTVINMAINSTLGRTTMTSLTTMIVAVVLFIFGGEVIRGFCFALMIGIAIGTYSSIFVATPIVVDLHKKEKK